MCKVCGIRKNNRPRGMCVHCFEAVRETERETEQTSRKVATVLPVPTQAQPGSEEKILILLARVAAGQVIHHPEDLGARRPAWVRSTGSRSTAKKYIDRRRRVNRFQAS